jgi:3-oxoacyl-[acyl-carrier protein] reductase
MEQTEGNNRVVVITGGASGIGRAMAEAFARHGDQVVIVGRREDALRTTAQAIGDNCTWQRADVSQHDQVAAAVDAIVSRFHKIDVLINNAGYSGFERGMTLDTPLRQAQEIWDDTVKVNLTGAFLMALAAAPHLRRPGGRIINISSDAALTGGAGLRLAGYAAAKAGLLGLTRALALEFSPQGITVNTIVPGFIPGTDMNGQLLSDEVIRGIAAQLPVRRPGHVEDVAAAALFLASPDAGFITGELLNVTGGRVFGR